MSKVPKISVEINGKVYEDEEVTSFIQAYVDGLWSIQIVVNGDGTTAVHDLENRADASEMMQPVLSIGTQHLLPPDDVGELNKLSDLRGAPKKSGQAGKREIVTIESKVYDIVTDVNGLPRAISEIAEIENEYAAKNCIFVSDVEPPMCVFEDKSSQKFKIRTKIEIRRPKTTNIEK